MGNDFNGKYVVKLFTPWRPTRDRPSRGVELSPLHRGTRARRGRALLSVRVAAGGYRGVRVDITESSSSIDAEAEAEVVEETEQGQARS